MARRGPAPFVPALTGVRAIAAAWVVLLHAGVVVQALLPGIAREYGLVARPGFLGVDLFFVLSGFIISYTYAAIFDTSTTARNWLRFLWARLARIYPVHLVLLAALVIAVKVIGFGATNQIEPERWSWLGLVESLLLVHAWFGNHDVWNTVSWSISSEWLAYLCFPALSAIALKAMRSPNRAISWGLTAVVAMLPALYDTIDRHVAALPDFSPIYIWAEFLAGCMTYRIFAGRAEEPSSRLPVALWLVALVFAAAVLVEADLPARWAVVFAPPLLVGLARGGDRSTAFLTRRAFVYLGKTSFALYMSHRLWLWVMHAFFPLATYASAGAATRIALVAAHVLPMFLIASVVFHAIEEPARHRLAARVHRPTGTPA